MEKRTSEGTELSREDAAHEEELLAAPKPQRKKVRLSGPVVPCKQGFSRQQLQEYLFRQRAKARVDTRIESHVKAGDCEACEREIMELEAEKPFLAQEVYPLPAPHIEVIRKATNETLKEETEGIAEIAKRLTKPLQTPAKSFSFEDLSVMYGKLRCVADLHKRETIAEQIKCACKSRWSRVASARKPAIEAAAAELMTFIKKEGGKITVNSRDDLHLEAGEQTCDFLNYLMTENYFLNVMGEPTWDHEFKNSDREVTINLNVEVLKKALAIPAVLATRASVNV